MDFCALPKSRWAPKISIIPYGDDHISEKFQAIAQAKDYHQIHLEIPLPLLTNSTSICSLGPLVNQDESDGVTQVNESPQQRKDGHFRVFFIPKFVSE